MNKKFLSCALILFNSLSAESEVTPTYVARSQGRNTVNKMIGVSDKVHLTDEERYVNLSATLGYARSFRSDEIAKCLFGCDLTCDGTKILVQGRDVANRDDKAWLADYFYLAPDYNSYFEVRPLIQNVILDLDLFVGLNDLVKGMYLRVHGPLNWTRWDLRFEERCDVLATGSYEEGYFNEGGMQNNELLGTFGDYAQGKTPLNTNETTAASTNIGIQFHPLNYAQIDSCQHSRTGFADLRLELGYDFYQADDAHFGINVQVAAPTGNRTSAQLAFDPVIGNRNHWEVGAGLSGHYDFYHDDDNRQAGLYIDFSLTHMNKAKEQRTFDLCGKPNSRYMLAMKMAADIVDTFMVVASASNTSNTVGQKTPLYLFDSQYIPVANLTTLNIPVSVAIQADFVAMLNYRYKKWNLDLGYNLWGRTCENFGRPQQVKQCCPTLCDGSRNQWALKGDAQMFGFASGVTNPPLSATQCGATIHSGTNATGDDCSTAVDTVDNCNVDNPLFAYLSDGTPLTHYNINGSISTIKTSVQPLFINCCDINLQRTRGLSHKIFGHVSHTWELDNWTPYVGVGGSAEFGRNDETDCIATVQCDKQCDNSSCDQFCCTKCLDCSLTQWSVWLKGGIYFE